jgi:thiol-disulfide isomerase/thioredoxin
LKAIAGHWVAAPAAMRRKLLASLFVTAALLAGCGSNTSSEPSPSAPAGSAGSPSRSLAADTVPAELDFTAKTIDGHDFSGLSLLGKPAVLWFWAPWCPTCQREAPMVGQIADVNPSVTFLGVAALDQLPAMQQFVDTYPVKGFSHLADTDGAVWAKFGVTHQPAYAFVDANGAVDVVKGSLSEPELTQRVTAMTDQ